MNPTAIKIALDSIASTQSSGRLPGWFLPNVHKAVDEDSIVTFSIYRSWQLEPNQHWEVGADGNKLLITEDPERGPLVAISISRPDCDRIELFKVRVKISSNQAEILETTDLESIVLSDLCFMSELSSPWPTE